MMLLKIKTVLIIIPFIILNSAHLYSSPDEFNRFFIEAAGKAKPSVVNIIIYKKSGRGGSYNLKKVADGTGTIITQDGMVVTNYHVVSRGDLYQFITSNGSRHDAVAFNDGSYYIADIKTDIAILRMGNRQGQTFVPITIASSNDLREGEWVLAIGNPYGLKQSITSGIVSSKGRNNIGFADIEDFIQSDVSINPGNSGGPLVNLHGEMVGLNTAIRTVSGGSQGISFAIPSQIVKHVCYELNRHGRVRRGWLGFLAREKRLNETGNNSYVEIFSIIRNSPAEHSGLREGDLVRKMDGKAITSLGMVIALIGKKPVGETISLTVSRDGKLYDFSIPLREKNEYQKIRKVLQSLFIRYGIEIDENVNSGNVVISSISPRSAGSDIAAGDIILALNGIRISNVDDFIRVFSKNALSISSMEIYRENMLHEVFFPDDNSR